MAKKKTAMVQPAAGRPGDLPLFADTKLQMKLINALEDQGNDRAYVVLEYHATWASVHFEGDENPKIINYID